MSRSGPLFARPLSVLTGAVFKDVFARQGFASREIVTRWAEIAGADIAAHCEPVKIQWPRPVGDDPPAPATLILRVEGPMGLEIQHSSTVIIARLNRFLGWNAIGKIALRQAPLSRPVRRKVPKPPDAAAVTRLAQALETIEDENLRQALARLGAVLKRN